MIQRSLAEIWDGRGGGGGSSVIYKTSTHV